MSRRAAPAVRAGRNLLATVLAAVFAFPVYWMVVTSFRSATDISRVDAPLLPIGGSLENYRKVFDREHFLSAMRVSLTVTGLTVLCALFVAFLGALAVSRYRFRGRKGFIVLILVLQMIPAEAMVISMFRVVDGWGMTNQVFGLTMVYVAFVLPFTIWTLRGFVAAVPKELEEAAMVDGCSRTRAFFTVTLPLVAPGLVATGVFAFIQAWNEFVFALVIMNRPEQQTLPVWIAAFNQGAKGTDWGGVMAGSTLMAVPVIVFFLLVQRRVSAGMTAGAVKG